MTTHPDRSYDWSACVVIVYCFRPASLWCERGVRATLVRRVFALKTVAPMHANHSRATALGVICHHVTWPQYRFRGTCCLTLFAILLPVRSHTTLRMLFMNSYIMRFLSIASCLLLAQSASTGCRGTSRLRMFIDSH